MRGDDAVLTTYNQMLQEFLKKIPLHFLPTCGNDAAQRLMTSSSDCAGYGGRLTDDWFGRLKSYFWVSVTVIEAAMFDTCRLSRSGPYAKMSVLMEMRLSWSWR